MWIDRNDGDFWYRFRKAASDGGSCSSPIIASNVSHRVALETTVLPLRDHVPRLFSFIGVHQLGTSEPHVPAPQHAFKMAIGSHAHRSHARTALAHVCPMTPKRAAMLSAVQIPL